MKDNIITTLKMHYGVTECMVYDRIDKSNYLEVMCVGGDVDFICLALKKMCETDDVKLLRSNDKVNVIAVQK